MRLAIVGATGEVGRMMLKKLEEEKIKPQVLSLYSSARSAGSTLNFEGTSKKVEELKEDSFDSGFDYVLFSAGASISKKFAPLAAARGATVIDNSSAFRGEREIPLVVPQINGHLLDGYRGIVANPNCSTIQLVLSLYRVQRKYGLKTVVVSTYQAVSGAGKKGIEELEGQEEGRDEACVFLRKIHRNVVPVIGEILESGFSQEEMKLVNETRKILEDPSIDVWPTTVRVPVVYGHSESILCQTRDPFEFEDLKRELASSEDVVLGGEKFTPLEIAGSDLVYVSRLRTFDARHFLIWNVADNVRVGAATNAVRILKIHSEKSR